MSTFETGAPVTGTGQPAPEAGADPSAGTLNTETGQPPTGGPPDAIPYSRFKEVNDRYAAVREYEDLARLGLDADSLRNLAEFEATMMQDPVGTWMSVAGNIEGLPQEVKDVIARHRESGQDPAATGQPPQPQQPQPADPQQPTTDEPPTWAQPLIEDYTTRQQQEEQQARSQMLDSILSQWRTADEAAGIKPPPDSVMLSFIAAHAQSGTTPEEIAVNARTAAMAWRAEVLQNEIRPPSGPGAGAPRPVPASGAPAGTPQTPKTLEEARRASLAFIQGGQQ